MSEWWTYRLGDFLLFSPRTYYRLFELYNADLWPAQILSPALGIVLFALIWRGGRLDGRIIAAILAACWLWVAWAYHLERYATINWAAVYFAAGFALEALLLLWMGVIRRRLAFRPVADVISRASLCLLGFALAVQPFMAPLLGRDWRQAELFAFAPDPTSVATLGVLLLSCDRMPWPLFAIPVLWCFVSGATIWTMESPDAFVMPFAALLAITLAASRARRRRASVASASGASPGLSDESVGP